MKKITKKKYCRKCKIELNDKNRYKCRLFCKRHYKENVNKWQVKNKDKVKNYYFNSREKIIKRIKAYKKIGKGLIKTRASNKRMRIKYKEKRKIQTRCWYARVKGKLIPNPCEICGEIKVHAHHQDYNRPFEVNWLCALHHRMIEGKQKYI